MKKAVLVLLGVVLWGAACRSQVPLSPSPLPPSPTAGDPLQASWDDRSFFQDGLVPADQAVLGQLPGASVYHLEYQLGPDLIHIAGKEQVRYTNTEDTALGDVRFRLFPNILGGAMEVQGLSVDGQPVTPRYSLENSLMIVPLASPLQPGQSLTLGMDFTVVVPDTVERNYGVLASADGVLALAHSYPMIPVFNQEGWNAEIPPQSGDVTFTDMAFYLVRVTAPKDVVLVGVGRELSHTESAETQTVTYAAGPARDFYLAASRDYTVVTEQAGQTKVNFYAPASEHGGAQAGAQAAVRAIEDYSSRYAPYPYTELDIVETPTLALGIEYPGMIAITNRIIGGNDTYLEATVAHEVGHQWFYNLVGSDQLDQPWLDESLTQFVTLQYFTDEYGQQGANGYRQSLQSRWDSIGDAPIPIGLPVAKYTDQEYSAIVYGRGGLFFDALRRQMGASAFDAFMRDYTQTYSWGIATPQGLQSLAEKHCSCDLAPLFKQWVYP